jgi:hypothetical protein
LPVARAVKRSTCVRASGVVVAVMVALSCWLLLRKTPHRSIPNVARYPQNGRRGCRQR